jgi:hypothetical protein
MSQVGRQQQQQNEQEQAPRATAISDAASSLYHLTIRLQNTYTHTHTNPFLPPTLTTLWTTVPLLRSGWTCA